MRRFVRQTLAPAIAGAVACCVVAVDPAWGQQASGAPAADAGPEIYLDEADPVPPPVVVTGGKIQDKYEDGTVRIDREVLKLSDDQLINHGVFIEYYPNGQKFAEGTYKNGVHEGPWTFWHDNGQVCKTVTFVDGLPEGQWDVYRPDGTLQAKRGYKRSLRDGVWMTYHEDGTTLRNEDTFVEGKRQGVSRLYFANGQVAREATYADNLLDGVATAWDESGRKLEEIHFAKGQRHGKYIVYRPDGSTVEQTYENGRLAARGGAAQ